MWYFYSNAKKYCDSQYHHNIAFVMKQLVAIIPVTQMLYYFPFKQLISANAQIKDRCLLYVSNWLLRTSKIDGNVGNQ